MKYPNYSVLMSVYKKDNADFFRAAMDSMWSQTVSTDDFVLVCDGPLTDSLEAVITYMVHEHGNLLNVVRLEENVGLSNALNIGIDCCKNELIARMDSDDISRPTRCEEELKLFVEYDNLVVCGCNIDEFYESDRNVRTRRIVPEEYEKIVKFSRIRQPFNHPTVMYKKSKIKKLGGYPNLRRKEDFDLFSRVINSGAYVRNVNKSLYLYRANDANYLRRKNKENLKAAFCAYRLHWKRGGCNWFEYVEICCGELLFYILPLKPMKLLSDLILRR